MVARWTEADLRRIVPGGRDDYISALVDGWGAVMSIGITTNVGLCHFLSQALHETGGFTVVRENCNWTLANCKSNWPLHFNTSAGGLAVQARFATCRTDVDKANLIYGKLVDGLGNTDPDDGYTFRGGSFSQLTGRAAYREYGQRLGVDLEGKPGMIEQPAVGLMVYCEIWRRFGLAQMADRNYGRAVGNAINRGNAFSKYQPIGAAGREEWFRACWRVLGRGEDLPDPLTLYLGSSGPEVKAVQGRLRDLGYAVGNIDGVFGREMARAVAAFKHDHGRDTGGTLEPGECIGQATRAALADARAIERPERAQMTIADLAQSGSRHVAEAQGMVNIGRSLAGLGLAGGAVAAVDGVPQPVTTATPPSVEMAQQALAWVPTFHQFMIPVIEGFRFFVAN
jgi:putative chitinase